MKLGGKRHFQWVELGAGVRLFMRQATALDEELARAAAMASARQIGDASEAFDRYGLKDLAPDDLFEAGKINSETLGYGLTLYACELAHRVVKEWDGVEGEDGEPLGLGLDTLGLFMVERPAPGAASFAKQFIALASGELEAQKRAGKPPADAPNGSGASAETSAEAAKT